MAEMAGTVDFLPPRHYLIGVVGVKDRVADRNFAKQSYTSDSLPSKHVVGGEVAGYITVKLH